MFADPTFYVLISFLLFFLVAGKPILKALRENMDGSIHEITHKLKEASSKRDIAQAYLNKMKLKFHEANKLAIEIQEQSVEIAESWKKKAQADLEFLILKRKNLVDQRIDMLSRRMSEDMKSKLSSLVISHLKSFLDENKRDFRQDEIIKKISQHRF